MKIRIARAHTIDGYLQANEGRVVVYNGCALISKGNTPDHLTLLSSLSAQFRFKQNDVISNAIRMYYARIDGEIIITPSRKIDYYEFTSDGNLGKTARKAVEQVFVGKMLE